MCDATVLPHCGHLFSCGAASVGDALRVRRRIFEVLRLGTPIRADYESRKLQQKDNGAACDLGLARVGSPKPS